jgi:O-antigen/teichoic acid export membrane protein
MSLAYSSLLGFFTELTLICLLRPKQFSVIPLFSGLRDIAKFGFYVTFSNLLRMVSINIPDLVIGKTGTSAEVAYFSRGMGLLSFLTMTINSGIKPVIAPYFANKNKKANQLNISYLRASMLMSAMTVPALAVAGYASVPLIDLFFGDQWAVSASVVSVLCYWSILRFLTSLSPSLLITTGHEKLLFYKELIMVIVNALTVYALYPSGLVAISAGLVVAGVIDLLVVILLLRFAVGITIVAHLKNLVPNVFLTITCVAWAAAVDQLITFNTASSILSIAVLGPTTFIIWMTSLYLIKHPFRIELNKLFSKILSKKA